MFQKVRNDNNMYTKPVQKPYTQNNQTIKNDKQGKNSNVWERTFVVTENNALVFSIEELRGAKEYRLTFKTRQNNRYDFNKEVSTYKYSYNPFGEGILKNEDLKKQNKDETQDKRETLTLDKAISIALIYKFYRDCHGFKSREKYDMPLNDIDSLLKQGKFSKLISKYGEILDELKECRKSYLEEKKAKKFYLLGEDKSK